MVSSTLTSKMKFPTVCVYVVFIICGRTHMACVYSCVYTCMWWTWAVARFIYPPTAPSCFVERESLNEPGSQWLLSKRPATPRDPAAWASSALGLQCHPLLFHGQWGWHSGPHDCTVSSVSSGASPLLYALIRFNVICILTICLSISDLYFEPQMHMSNSLQISSPKCQDVF